MNSADPNASYGARLDKVAAVRGESVQETIGYLRELGIAADEESNVLSVAQVHSALAGTFPRKDPDDLRGMIGQAFAAARESKPATWRTMKLSVLKNRLLGIDSSFDETDYGFPTLTLMASAYDDLLALDPNRPFVTFVPSDALPIEDEPASTPRASRIREDLWRAIIDYSSGTTYIWDTDRGIARGKYLDEDSALVFPTVTAETVQGWRLEFVEQRLVGASPELEERLRAWIMAPSRYRLPPRLLEDWNEVQKTNVLQILEGFFVLHAVAAPANVERSTNATDGSQAPRNTRELMHRAVDIMTEEELARLELTPAVVLRLLNAQTVR